jgi:hypothetical protein
MGSGSLRRKEEGRKKREEEERADCVSQHVARPEDCGAGFFERVGCGSGVDCLIGFFVSHDGGMVQEGRGAEGGYMRGKTSTQGGRWGWGGEEREQTRNTRRRRRARGRRRNNITTRREKSRAKNAQDTANLTHTPTSRPIHPPPAPRRVTPLLPPNANESPPPSTADKSPHPLHPPRAHALCSGFWISIHSSRIRIHSFLPSLSLPVPDLPLDLDPIFGFAFGFDFMDSSLFQNSNRNCNTMAHKKRSVL